MRETQTRATRPGVSRVPFCRTHGRLDADRSPARGRVTKGSVARAPTTATDRFSIPRQARLSSVAAFHHGPPNACWSASVGTPAFAIGLTWCCRQRQTRYGNGPPWRPFRGGPKQRAGFQGHGPARGRERFDVVGLLSCPRRPFVVVAQDRIRITRLTGKTPAAVGAHGAPTAP